MAAYNVIKWNSANPGKLQPFVIKPVFDLNDEHLVEIMFFIEVGDHALNQRDEGLIVCWNWMDRDAHLVVFTIDFKCSPTTRFQIA